MGITHIVLNNIGLNIVYWLKHSWQEMGPVSAMLFSVENFNQQFPVSLF